MTESRSASEMNTSCKTCAECGAGEGIELCIGIGRDFGKEWRRELGRACGLLSVPWPLLLRRRAFIWAPDR